MRAHVAAGRIGSCLSHLVDFRQAAGEFCPHHVGHYLGLDTHDTAVVSKGLGLQPGMVVTVEPGLYVPRKATKAPER